MNNLEFFAWQSSDEWKDGQAEAHDCEGYPGIAHDFETAKEETARLRRALAQIAAGTVPHREGNTVAEDYSEFAADALEAK